jgi:hypothetical protein
MSFYYCGNGRNKRERNGRRTIDTTPSILQWSTPQLLIVIGEGHLGKWSCGIMDKNFQWAIINLQGKR